MTISQASLPIWNPFKKGYLDDPYPIFSVFREQNPVHQGINKHWMLFKHEDVKFILSDPVFETPTVSELVELANAHLDGARNLNKLAEISSKWLLFLDPPEHTEIRGLVYKAWRVFDMEASVLEIVDATLNRMESRREVDMALEFGGRIPLLVVCRLLGLPDNDLEKLRDWSVALGQVLEQFETIEKLVACNERAKDVFGYIEDCIVAKTKSPQNDLISKLIEENEKLAEPLERSALISVIILFVLAGTETLSSFLGSCVGVLVKHPEQRDLWLNDDSITQRAIDELLRYISPAQFITRVPSRDVEIRGKHIPKGSMIMGCLASANRDSDVFDDPDGLDLTRNPNPHLGFGGGIHYCLGATLAKTEIRIAIPAIFERFPELHLDPNRDAEYMRRFNIRGLSSLPVILD